MSSASQIDYAAMPEDQLAEMLSKIKSSRETEELRARLPAQLAPFASNISIIKPISGGGADGLGGVHCCACSVKERKICMSVAVVPSPHSHSEEADSENSEEVDSKETHGKPLELVWKDWWTSSRYFTGSADSYMHSISLRLWSSSPWNAFEGDSFYRPVR
ncbi:hypothetical protein BGY98DRAFT_687963 [Russula aff. rugulosa BPL654]|nr:hypothetical protein BGY98DRAFT_687963 [Russula aff. rugulosa BPL654]